MATDQPVLSVPPEITSLIFGHCLASYHLREWPSRHNAPWILTQICRQWRDICLETPELWSYISLGEIGSVQLLKEWLSRAKNYPLTIMLQAVGDDRSGELMETLLSHCPWWQDVCFSLTKSSYRQLRSYCGPFPSLRRFKLSYHSTDAEEEPIVIRDAPLLRDARMDDIMYPKVDIPWEQLTTVHFESLSAEKAMVAVRRCPNIQRFHGLWRSGHSSPSPATAPLTLPFLRWLNIPSASILPYLTVPRLERLAIGHISDDIEVASDAFQSLVSRSSCDLKFLAINRLKNTPPAAFQRLLRATNSIIHLRLWNRYASPGFHDQIQVLAEGSILPRLKHLQIHDYSDEDRYSSVLDVLRSRPTVSVELSLSTTALGPPEPGEGRVPPDAVMTDFRALAEAGSKLRITSREKGGPRVIIDTFAD
ncbi:hypothetical protein FB451DRAFT_1124108 [Mycena latifolia]|nr:hypothetical protein FB451DRAFT_1124108 [Mycena latifolia]